MKLIFYILGTVVHIIPCIFFSLFYYMLLILNVQRKGMGIIFNLSLWYKTRSPLIPGHEKQGVIILGSIRSIHRFKERR
jgi:hypothetical protein